jgi:hypothetical protein
MTQETLTKKRDTKILQVHMKPEERLALDEYAKRQGEKVSVIVRQALREKIRQDNQ